VIRVGFAFSQMGNGWLGGLNYFHNLFAAILALPGRRIAPVILIDDDRSRALLENFPPLPVIRNSTFGVRSRWGRLQSASYRRFKRDLVVEAVLRWHRIAALSHSHRLGFGSAVPAIAWIPDFQHVHLPEFFGAQEIATRDSYYADLAATSQRVILSSRDAQRDFRRLFPQAADKARVLPFVSGVGDAAALPGRAGLAQRYDAGQPYFLVANQFWAHKNHRLIIDALRVLKAQGLSPPVLATGDTNDYRWPNHHGDLMRHAQAQDVLEIFRVLGVIPREDLLGLMKHAVAVLNPSRFEGWNTSIEEAKTLGVRVIASDIAVHREQAAPGALYVDPDRPDELAAAMAKLWAERDRPAAAAGAPFATRRNAFARAYEDIVLELLASRRSGRA